MRLPFTKMHGTANDYVYVNGFEEKLSDPAGVSRLVSDRHRGIGGDGLILIQPSDAADCRMEMYNADGSRGKMCGNGIRCVAKYVYDRGMARKNPLAIETDSGVKTVEVHTRDDRVVAATVDMGKPVLEPERIPARAPGPRLVNQPVEVAGKTWMATCLSMGNPHCVVFVQDVESLDLATLGPPFEHHEWFPEQVNTEFVQILARNELRMRVWERGSGETQSCGTGACAAAVAGALAGKSDRVATVHLNGGELDIEWRDEDNHVTMRGEAVEVFRGEIELP